jgi:phosphodiesterase/alkaline phosphatase D-like protein
VRSFRTTGAGQPPLAVTLPVTATGDTTAGLTGQVNPKGQTAAYTFEYGTSTSFGQISPVVVLDDADASEDVSAALTGLASNTTYFYRVVATNATGTSAGAVRTFTTTGTVTAPTATTGSATSVSSTGATLAGVVDPHGGQTAFTFEYGPTNAFGSITAVDQVDGGGSQTVTLPVSGLAPATQYRFRTVATNSAGTSTGTVGTFTTAPGT